MQVSVLVLSLVEFLRQVLGSLVRPTEDNALVDNELRVKLVNSLHLVPLVQEHVVMGETDEHKFLHEVDDFGFGHEFLLEGLNADREGG